MQRSFAVKSLPPHSRGQVFRSAVHHSTKRNDQPGIIRPAKAFFYLFCAWQPCCCFPMTSTDDAELRHAGTTAAYEQSEISRTFSRKVNKRRHRQIRCILGSNEASQDRGRHPEHGRKHSEKSWYLLVKASSRAVICNRLRRCSPLRQTIMHKGLKRTKKGKDARVESLY